jgi:transcriptional regulator with XRE-family HTH domain
MSPARSIQPSPPRIIAAARRVAVTLGLEVCDERIRRGWSQAHLARKAGVSPSMVHGIEAGESATIDGYARLADALGLDLASSLLPADRRTTPKVADPVHSALGELEAVQLSGHRFEVRLDEPYQHYQFAGRADLVAIDHDRRALLHIENRTRFPDIQAFLGSFNAKRAYLDRELAQRVGLHRFASVTHAVVALWSSEVLHALRIREMTFRSACPDPPDAFAAWWAGQPPTRGISSTLIVLDPTARDRQRQWVHLDQARVIRPRHRGYADTADALLRAHRAT